MPKKKTKESSILPACPADEVFSDSEGEERQVSRKKIARKPKGEEERNEENSSSEEEEQEQKRSSSKKKISHKNDSSSSDDDDSSSSEDEEQGEDMEKKIEKREIKENVSQEISKPLNPDGFTKVNVVHKWVGSLDEFSKNPEKAISELNEHSKAMFNSTLKENELIATTTNKMTPKVAHNQHILKDIRLKKIKNTFNQEIMISINGINTKDQKTFSTSSSQKSGVHIAFKGEDVQKMDKVLIEGNKLSSEHKFLKFYPGWNAENITNLITKVPNDTTSLVAVGHPILKIYEDTFNETGKTSDFQLLSGGKYVVMQQDQVDLCVNYIKEELEKHIQMVNLQDLKFEISRAFHDPKLTKGESWNDHSVGFEGIDVNKKENLKTINAAKEQVGYLIAEFEITFKNC